MSSPTPLRYSVAGALRAELARRKLTSLDLARVLDTSQSSAARRLSGEVGLDLDELATIASWLGLPPTALLLDEGKVAPSRKAVA